MSATLPIAFTGSAMPDGWSGNYKQFFELIVERLNGTVTGDFPGGIIGGTQPTEDKGVFYDTVNYNVLLWNEDKGRYVITGGPPIGSIFPILSLQASPPTNYLFLHGQELEKATYPELSLLIGNHFEQDGDTNQVTHFRLPELRGRLIVVAGSGASDPAGTTEGVLRNRLLGKYFNTTYPANKELHANPPSERARFKADVLKINDTVEMIDNLPPSLALNYIVRCDPIQPAT